MDGFLLTYYFMAAAREWIRQTAARTGPNGAHCEGPMSSRAVNDETYDDIIINCYGTSGTDKHVLIRFCYDSNISIESLQLLLRPNLNVFPKKT